jgi:hypothetical protein
MMEKQYLAKLGTLTQHHQWEAFMEMLNAHMDNHQRKLEQASEVTELYRAQGAIMALKSLTKLKDEINGLRKET